MKKLETDVVFLDTSAIQKSNFTQSKMMRELANFASNGLIKIMMTSIVYQETKARIYKEVSRVRSEVKKYNPDSSWMVLKNIERFKPLFENTTFSVEEVSEEIIHIFEQFIQVAKVEVIRSDIASVEEVFDHYFNEQYPFGDGTKKNEFPDAFIVNTVEKWCEQKRKKAFLLSGDNGILNYRSDKVIPVGDIAVLLDKINRVVEQQKILDKIQQLFEMNYDRIQSDIEAIIAQPLEEHLSQSSGMSGHYVDEVELDSVNSVYIDNYSITHVDENEAMLEVVGNVTVDFSVAYVDRRFAFYDKEDDIWHGEEYETTSMSDTIPFKADAKIAHNPIAGKEFADYSGIESIYFDRPFEF
jgi:hypothetical protein